jgi:F-type H+-transporting ATPase subunit gamma
VQAVANFREYNARIQQLQNMRRVTLAMKMLSTTKMARAQEAMARAQAFEREWSSLVRMVANLGRGGRDPLLLPRESPESAFVLMITSDMGLCGGFNNNLNRVVAGWLAENQPKYRILRFSFCGRKGYQFARDQVELRSYYENSVRRPDLKLAMQIGKEIFATYAEGKYDEVFIARNRYFDPLWQEPVVERLLPVDLGAMPPAAGISPLVLMEPAPSQLLPHLLSRHVGHRIFAALLENSSGEHAARMAAMDSASKNIDGLCATYTLLRNRARQASITTELIEVVSGAEALR